MDRLRWATKIRPEARTENKFVGKEGERERERERDDFFEKFSERGVRSRPRLCVRADRKSGIDCLGAWGKGVGLQPWCYVKGGDGG